MTIPESEVLQACKILFGSNIDPSRAFLLYIQPSGVKSAYRRRAKETHPDIMNGIDPQPKHRTTQFVEILKAYEILKTFFKERDKGLWLSPVNSILRSSGEETSGRKEPTEESYVRMPERTLEIGRYLYYRGFISYKALIEAVTWQRNQRPVIGDIAVYWGWLNSCGIRQITSAHHVIGRFGEKAVNLGLLSLSQVKTLLSYQRSKQERLGKFFVEHNFLTQEELNDTLIQLKIHNARVQRHVLKTAPH